MKTRKKIGIIGAGGFGKETLCCLIDSIANTSLKIEDIACFLVSDEHLETDFLLGIPVVPLSKFQPKNYDVVVAVGDPANRRKIVEKLPKKTTFTTIIHPKASISKWVDIGEGSIITAGAVLTCDIKIGKHAHINLHTSIGHDCQIGDYFTSAPAANISGHCHFGDGVYIGTNASIREKISICSNVTIGMGGIVVKNIDESGVYIGNPLKKLEKK
jgi:sugar O-acyltransferase (sialic acid O-acetyltransferase NeuD family)